ncbi:MAG: glycosyltransferase [Saprospiraceae bacterium]|nr:glycosyltransferase [Saprospiraceae bacterium]
MRKKIFYEHFEKLANRRGQSRSARSYYWNSITKECAFFVHEDDTVLEVGCGSGDLLAGLQCSKKVGIDFSPAMIETAKQRGHEGIDFICLEAERASELEEKFDVIILSNLVGVVDDVQSVFDQLKSIVKPQGRIIINYYSQLWEPILKFGSLIGLRDRIPNQNWLSGFDIQNLLYLSGFDTYRKSKSLILPYNIPIISFLVNKILARLPLFRQLCLNEFVHARLQPSVPTKEYKTSVIIPARNEAGNIEAAIQRLPDFGGGVEIVYVEGNSTDNTWEVIQEMAKKYQDSHEIQIMQQDGKGKGDAVRKGFAAATGDILMILDADLTVPPEDIPKFYDALVAGKGEFINGCRLIYPMESKAMRFLNMLGNKFFSYLFSWLIEQPIKDTLCGTKVLFAEDYQKLIANRKYFGEFDPFGDFDLIFGAFKLNLKIIDLPIRYRDRTYGDTNISRFKHGIILLRMCWFAARKLKFRS